METEAFGKPHQLAALLGMKTPDTTVNQVHPCLRPDSAPEGGKRNGVPFRAVNAFPLPSFAHRADADRAILTLDGELGGEE